MNLGKSGWRDRKNESITRVRRNLEEDGFDEGSHLTQVRTPLTTQGL